eukprot:1161671-Pelagomonas_calceolata.AAC.37
MPLFIAETCLKHSASSSTALLLSVCAQGRKYKKRSWISWPMPCVYATRLIPDTSTWARMQGVYTKAMQHAKKGKGQYVFQAGMHKERNETLSIGSTRSSKKSSEPGVLICKGIQEGLQACTDALHNGKGWPILYICAIHFSFGAGKMQNVWHKRVGLTNPNVPKQHLWVTPGHAGPATKDAVICR